MLQLSNNSGFEKKLFITFEKISSGSIERLLSKFELPDEIILITSVVPGGCDRYHPVL